MFVSILKYKFEENKIINIGRVLLLILKIIYDRDKEIENFIVIIYYKLLINFKNLNNEEFEGFYYENEFEKFEKKEDLNKLFLLLEGGNVKIIDKQIEFKKEYLLYLFNLLNF